MINNWIIFYCCDHYLSWFAVDDRTLPWCCWWIGGHSNNQSHQHWLASSNY